MRRSKASQLPRLQGRGQVSHSVAVANLWVAVDSLLAAVASPLVLVKRLHQKRMAAEEISCHALIAVAALRKTVLRST